MLTFEQNGFNIWQIEKAFGSNIKSNMTTEMSTSENDQQKVVLPHVKGLTTKIGRILKKPNQIRCEISQQLNIRMVKLGITKRGMSTLTRQPVAVCRTICGREENKQTV
ncbi:hypothetical protein HHI36_012708 [Cryptolaemus montrouzieri]|uniref:Uncharacterized protein n=1 Tax=Cryptolaemus montrouzieri TaxID=559131 RepID=A0ABD2NFB0_9CUCU